MGASVRPVSDPYADLLADLPPVKKRDRFASPSVDPYADLLADLPAKPGALQQAKSGAVGIGEQLKQLALHPLESAQRIGEGIAQSAREATATRIGDRPGQGTLSRQERADIERRLGRPLDLPVATADTPGAVDLATSQRGIINTAANLGFALAPTMGLPARLATNAGLGAFNDPEQPIRGAITGAGVGEAIHGATKIPGFVREGRALARQADLPSTATAVREQILANADPKDVAFAMQDPKFRRLFGGDVQGPNAPSRMLDAIPPALTPEQRTLRARLGQDLGIDPDAIGLAARRKERNLPPRLRQPKDAPAGAEAVPVGQDTNSLLEYYLLREADVDAPGQINPAAYQPGPVGAAARRPKETLPPALRQPVEPPPTAETVSLGRDLNADDAAREAFRERLAKGFKISPEEMGEIRRRPGGSTASVPTPPRTIVDPYADLLADLPESPKIPTEPIPTIGEEVVSAGRGTGAGPAPVASAFPSGATPEIQGKAKRAANVVAQEEPPSSTPPAYQEPATVANVAREKGPQSPTDVLNVAKLSLDVDVQKRLADQVEQFRQLRESQKQTFAEADINRKAILDELVGGNPKALRLDDAKRLSGESLLARRDLVRSNDEMITQLSKQVQDGTLALDEHLQAVELIRKATEQNDHLLSDLVVGSSQKGRDLNLLRRIANRDLSPDTWMIQAKRLLGDHPLTDIMQSEIRRLAQIAQEACG